MLSRSFLSALVTLLALNWAEGQPMVTVEQGDLVGMTVDVSDEGCNITLMNQYLGIPFAEPPKRFQKPEMKEKWDGVWNATYNRDACLQAPSDYLFANMSEDCLYLNIFTPAGSMGGNMSLPVMVWIHGGTWTSGSGNAFNGRSLVVSGKVIVVTINYRLGVFGFFSIGTKEAPGNYGLLDQLAALKWINKNIGAFGGDPNKVTLFGDGAGAASIDFHRLARPSWNYFSKAIIQSGSALASWAFVNYPKEKTMEKAWNFGKKLNCTGKPEMFLDCMQKVDAWDIVELWMKYGKPITPPTIDGWFITDTPENLFKKWMFKQAPIITGFNEDEGTFALYFGILWNYAGMKKRPPVTHENFTMGMQEMLYEMMMMKPDPILIASIAQQYIDWDEYSMNMDMYDYFDAYAEVVTDRTTACPVKMDAKYNSWSSNTFFYVFDVEPEVTIWGNPMMKTPWLKAGALEMIPFLFGKGFRPREMFYNKSQTPEEMMIGKTIRKLWTNFARTGHPSKSSMDDYEMDEELHWPKYNTTHQFYKVLKEDFPNEWYIKNEKCAFWTKYLPKLVNFAMSQTAEMMQDTYKQSFVAWHKSFQEWKQAFYSYQDQNMMGAWDSGNSDSEDKMMMMMMDD